MPGLSRGRLSAPWCAGLPCFLACLALLAGFSRPARADSAAAAQGAVPQELQDALRSLATADAAGRQKVYDLVAAKGDARLVPALRAFKDQRLQDRDGKLVLYGDQVDLPGQGKAFPILDAFTLQQLKNPDGSPLYLVRDKIDLGAPGMMRIPARARAEQMTTVPELISSLSLLDPDRDKRVASLTDVGDKANKALYSSEWPRALLAGLDRDAILLSGLLKKTPPPPPALAGAIGPALDSVAKVTHEVDAQMAAGKRVSLPSGMLWGLTASLKAVQASAPDDFTAGQLGSLLQPPTDYQQQLDAQSKATDDARKFRPILAGHLQKEQSSYFRRYISESLARLDLAVGDAAAKVAAAHTLGDIGTSAGEGTMSHALENAQLDGQNDVVSALREAIARAESYQQKVRLAQGAFAGLSLGSILVLLALGLSIIFGLMGVINMAHGEFMMVGAFTTWLVSEWFKAHLGGWFDYYLVAAIPAAFLVSAAVGWICEVSIVRHLYGRPLETLLATWGIGLILIQQARSRFGDNLHVTPPRWLVGSLEVAPDLSLGRNRLFIILYCMVCIGFVYYLVNRTKLGLLLRATTQGRDMAQALGVATRRVDALTFALGAGLAGLAGVAVPMYDKINPNMGQDVIVDCFMVVVVGGVGKLAGVICAGLGLGFISKYMEQVLGTLHSIPALASGASVMAKVAVLGLIITFLQWRPQGLFPPKGRLADA